jgi:gas vesicle protein
MTSGQKFLGGILLGVAAGVAIALFVNSDKGKEIISDISDAADDAAHNIKNKYSDLGKQLKDLLKKGKRVLDDVEEKVSEYTG